jgi:hypothetical protein
MVRDRATAVVSRIHIVVIPRTDVGILQRHAARSVEF